jgi:hypothetical protein
MTQCKLEKGCKLEIACIFLVILPNGERPTLRGEPQCTGLPLILSPPPIVLFPPNNFDQLYHIHMSC